jgi:IS4 transposase
MSRIMLLEKISREADDLARQYNKTKDPGLRDQWYELLKKVSQVSVEEPLDYSRKRNRI